MSEAGPDIFQEAAERLGLQLTTCLVIEDAVSGVAAARAAGARRLGLTTHFLPNSSRWMELKGRPRTWPRHRMKCSGGDDHATRETE